MSEDAASKDPPPSFSSFNPALLPAPKTASQPRASSTGHKNVRPALDLQQEDPEDRTKSVNKRHHESLNEDRRKHTHRRSHDDRDQEKRTRQQGRASRSRTDDIAKRRAHSHQKSGKESSRRSSRSRSRSPSRDRIENRHKRKDVEYSPSAQLPTETFDGDLFFTDTQGDVAALTYGPDRSKVPVTSRSRHHTVIGANKLTSPSRPSQSQDDNPESSRDRHSSKKLQPADDDSFITLSGSSKERVTNSQRFSRLDNLLQVGVIAEAEEEAGPDPSASRSGAAPTHPQQQSTELKRKAEQRVGTDPTDIDAWLDLVRCHSLLIACGSRQRHAAGDQGAQLPRSVVVDIQLSILDKARKAHAANRDSILLLLQRCDLLARQSSWDHDQIDKEYRRIISLAKNDAVGSKALLVQSWSEYLRWRLHQWELFDVNSLLELWAEANAHLQNHLYAPQLADTDLEAARNGLRELYFILLRLLARSGYQERAAALIQMQLGLNLRYRDEVDRIIAGGETEPGEALIRRLQDELERYWNSDAERSLDTPTSRHPEAAVTGDDRDEVNSWLALERFRSQHRALPARLTDLPEWECEGDEIDPYAVVLFGDLLPFLSAVSNEALLLEMIDASLAALGLPRGLLTGIASITGQLVGNVASCSAWHLECPPPRDFLPHWMAGEPVSDDVSKASRPRLADPHTLPLICGNFSIEDLFGVSSLFHFLKRLTSSEARLARLIKLVESCSTFLLHSAFRILRLALVFHQHPRAGTKLAKKLLAETEDDYWLWHAYAQAELAQSNHGVAIKVYETVLQALQSKSQPASSPLLATLHTALIDAHLEGGNEQSCLLAIQRAVRSRFSADLGSNRVEGTKSHPSLQELRQGLDDLLKERDLREASFAPRIIFCSSIVAYLSVPGTSLDAFLHDFTSKMSEQKTSETTAQASVLVRRFIARHLSLQRSYRPLTIREALDTMIDQHPYDLSLWSLSASLEIKNKVENHLRTRLDKALSGDHLLAEPKPRCLREEQKQMLWLFRIFVELHMYEFRFDEKSVRGLFEEAVESDAGHHSTEIWMAFLDFEAALLIDRRKNVERNKSKQRRRMKAVFYQAIKACPSDKSIYLRAFEAPLRESISLDELEMLYNSMCEKGIRIFVDFEDFLRQARQDENTIADSRDDSDLSDGAEEPDDPFDPNLPYRKRDIKYEQVGGGSIEASWSPSATRIPSNTGVVTLLSQQSQACRSTHGPAGLQCLPIELLYRILIESKSSAFPFVCRYFRQVFGQAPDIVKLRYLEGKWFDSYAAFVESFPHQSRSWKLFKSKIRAHMMEFTQRTDKGVVVLATDYDGPAMDLPEPEVGKIVRTGHLNPCTFAAAFPICTIPILRAFSQLTSIPSSFKRHNEMKWVEIRKSLGKGSPHDGPSLPRRLFRQLQAPSLTGPRISSDDGDVPRKRRKKNRKRSYEEQNDNSLASDGDHKREEHEQKAGLPSDLVHLLTVLALKDDGRKDLSLRIGPVPSSDQLRFLIEMLDHYMANPSSHEGFPLAMSVHHRSYSLTNLLLLFGADSRLKENLAIKIAIQNGDLSALKLLVEGPNLDLSSLPPFRSQIEQLPIQTKPVVELRQAELRLAIQAHHWHIVDYLWHKRNVVPDMACLRLIEKARR